MTSFWAFGSNGKNKKFLASKPIIFFKPHFRKKIEKWYLIKKNFVIMEGSGGTLVIAGGDAAAVEADDDELIWAL